MFWFNVKKNRRRGVHRKKRLRRTATLREWVWPSIGWMGLLRFWEIQLKRNDGSAHSLAIGFAGGALASCTPFLGAHMLLAVAVTWPLGGNPLAALIGTMVGNPWTFPFIWVSSYELGSFMLGRSTEGGLPDELVFGHMLENFFFYWNTYLLPMTLGGAVIGLGVGAFFYLVLRVNIMRYRRDRQTLLQAARARQVRPAA